MKQNEITKGRVTAISVDSETGVPEHLVVGDHNVVIPTDKLDTNIPENVDPSIYLARRFIGREIPFKVLSRDKKQIVGSHVDAVEELRKGTLPKLQEGTLHEGVVTFVARREVEVEVGNSVAVRIPAQEYAYGHVSDLRNIVKPGQILQIEIKGTNENGKFVGSRLNLIHNPWDNIRDRYKPRNIYLGTVTGRLQDKGLFVSLADGIDALASPIPFFPVNVGDCVSLEISSIDDNNCKIKGRITGLAPAV